MNKAVGGVCSPTALPAPDLKLAYAEPVMPLSPNRMMGKYELVHIWPENLAPKKVRPALGGMLAARDPVWDGEGWGYDRTA